MKPTNVLLPVFGLLAFASAQRQVLVTYPHDTPPSILESAKKAILATVSGTVALGSLHSLTNN